MGGKNPAIVSATPTSTRRPKASCARAFGFSGQKCSANSRVYVERPVYDEFVQLLAEKTEAITIGDPVDRENWLGPGHQPARARPLRERRRRSASATVASSPAASG